MSEPTFEWDGQSGKRYKYWIYPINTAFRDQPGNYIYAKINPVKNQWQAVYIGQTVSLSQRLAGHEKEQAAIRNGATHIHAHLAASDEQARRIEESDLIRKWNPPCNEQV